MRWVRKKETWSVGIVWVDSLETGGNARGVVMFVSAEGRASQPMVRATRPGIRRCPPAPEAENVRTQAIPDEGS